MVDEINAELERIGVASVAGESEGLDAVAELPGGVVQIADTESYYVRAESLLEALRELEHAEEGVDPAEHYERVWDALNDLEEVAL